jgi:hypothetical protein
MHFAAISCLFLACLAALLSSCAAPIQSPGARHDIVIYGGTSAGVAAAVAAARAGRSVVLIEPTQHLGGLSSSGLGATDIGNKSAIGGIAREFYRRVRSHYDDRAAWTWESREEFKGHGHPAGEDAAWTFEPHVAEKIFLDLVARERIDVVLGERLELGRVVPLRDRRITSIEMESGRRFEGTYFIDATYEGDLLARAGVSFHVGREPNARYGETLNGVQTRNATKHQFRQRVDPYVKPGDPSSGLVWGVSAEQPGAEGEGDAHVQAYCFRLCATDVAENRSAWPKPADYDPARYELLLRYFEAGESMAPWHPLFMPNRKTDANNNGAFSFDMIGAADRYALASWAERARIVAAHESYQKGLLWALANEARVPQAVREEFQRFGLPKDEFRDNGGWPRLLYIREARRMVGEYVMTEHECRGARVAPRSIGLAAYTMDSHNVQRYVDASGAVRNEGDVQVGGFPPYPIDYGAILPRREQCRNLFVPVCMSASHIAYGSIRMEPVFMVLGESAAIAASLAIVQGVDPHALEYDDLRARLLAAGQVLDAR